VQAKKAYHVEMMAKVDYWHKFETIVSKWKKILTIIMNVGCSTHVKNNLASKDKWNMIASNFKKIFDFMVRIGQNQDYYAMDI
jgi:hypothetical protein